jgi:LysM repeat protein
MINWPKRSVFYIFLFVNLLALSQNKNQAYLSYIQQYYQLAVKQQNEHRIPASIVLAQGLLESGAGLSEFARQSNNHFGIKCNDWAGAKIYHDDDVKGECFRKYDQVIDSYEDHAIFLKTRSRYASLFNLEPSDYEGWAHGLKKAGYATDPTYAYKLISIIEVYNLHQYDLGNISVEALGSETKKENSGYGSIGTIKAAANHQLFRVNSVKFVTSANGDTYASIADEFNVTESRIRNYNEVSAAEKLPVGTRVFIESKKNKAPKNCESHVVAEGESMYSIAQSYAIKIEKLYTLNEIPFTEGVKFGQTLKLR